MTNEQVYQMPFARVWPLLEQKALRKGRTSDEVTAVVTWLTGYEKDDLERMQKDETSYGDFFRNAPAMNPNRFLIKGSVCGVKLDSIEDPLMRDIRYLDKLIDELAKGKKLEKVQTATFRGQQGRISRPVRAILSGRL